MSGRLRNRRSEMNQRSSTPADDDLPTMVPRESFMRIGGGLKPTPGYFQPINMTTATISALDGVKSMPIHCVVEQLTTCDDSDPKFGLLGKSPSANGGTPVVELDTYAILPGTTMFSEIVRTALMKIGYTASEAVGAKGAVQIKNWKPLSFDTITENPNSTLDEILGDLTSFATLRIRLCSNAKVTAMEEVKDKLLEFLLDRSQGILSGCPIDKKLLTQISRGDYSASLPDGSKEAFIKWYKDSRQTQSHTPSVSASNTSSVSHLRLTPTAVPHTPKAHSPLPTTVTTFSSPPRFDGSFPFRSRARTSFDIENEIPRLQKWFTVNQHPTREQMDVYLNELNSLDSRRGKKPLDLTNIIYWFKNARAALRRSSKCSPGEGDEAHPPEGHDESLDERVRTTTPENVPVLPNRNAIYVVQPIHHQVDKIEVVQPREEAEDMYEEDDDDDEPQDFSHNSLKSGVQEIGETNNNHVPMEQEEATDLSVHRQKGVGLFRIKNENCDPMSLRMPVPPMPFRMKKEDENDFLSSSSSPSPSPTSAGLPASSQPLPLQSSHTALQMAAMSHALSMHYMHPAAALYQNSPAVQGFKDSSLSPTSSESLSDRKKRSRVFIDPLSEIPKLEKWFEDDTHPSSYMIEKYTEELNRSAYRQRFPNLEPKNVQLWFKNHRAKVKRQRLGMDSMDGLDTASPLTAREHDGLSPSMLQHNEGLSPAMAPHNDGLSPALAQRGMSPATTQVS